MNGGLPLGVQGVRSGVLTVQRIEQYHIDDWNFIAGKGNYGERILLTPAYRVVRSDGSTEHLHWHSPEDQRFVSNSLKAEFLEDLAAQNGWLTEYQEWEYYKINSHHVPEVSVRRAEQRPGELPASMPEAVGVLMAARPVVTTNQTLETMHNHQAADIQFVEESKKAEYQAVWGDQQGAHAARWYECLSGWLTEAQELYFDINGRHTTWDFDVPFLPEVLGSLVEYPTKAPTLTPTSSPTSHAPTAAPTPATCTLTQTASREYAWITVDQGWTQINGYPYYNCGATSGTSQDKRAEIEADIAGNGVPSTLGTARVMMYHEYNGNLECQGSWYYDSNLGMYRMPDGEFSTGIANREVFFYCPPNTP